MTKKYLPGLVFLALFVTSLSVKAALITFTVGLTGAAEVPGPGDPDGSGTATLVFDDSANTVAWTFVFANIDPLTAAHIHQAPVGVAGPVVVPLGIALSGVTSLSATLLSQILATPTNFYVNLHNAPFPAGAIRGQLGAPTSIVFEPATLALLGLGFGALGIARRRRR